MLIQVKRVVPHLRVSKHGSGTRYPHMELKTLGADKRARNIGARKENIKFLRTMCDRHKLT